MLHRALLDDHGTIPSRAGVGLKAEHYRTIIDVEPNIGFFEIHAEDYRGAGGPPLNDARANPAHIETTVRAIVNWPARVAAAIARSVLRIALAIPFFRSGLTRWDGFGSLPPSAACLPRPA